MRDFLLGVRVLDLDFSVEGDALDLAWRLAGMTNGSVTTHRRFGTATVTLEGTRVDLVTARRETYPLQGQLPDVAPGSIADDLARRDFTINAMALSVSEAESDVVDPCNGRNDLDARAIRILHPGSFADDPTRMFRAVRYEQRFGFEFEAETRECMNRAISSGCMDSVSGDRWRHEIERILDEADPGPPLLRASQLGLLAGLHPALAKDEGLRRLPKCHEKATEADEWLAAMFAPLSVSEGEDVVQRLRLFGRKVTLARDTIQVRKAESSIKRASTHPSSLFRLLSDFHLAAVSLNAKIATDPLISSTLQFYLDEVRHRGPSISGNEVLEMGATQGPAVGQILSQIRDARLDGRVTTIDEERALARVLVSRDEERAGKRSP